VTNTSEETPEVVPSPEKENKENVEVVEEEEPEPVVMTLDEYKAQQKSKTVRKDFNLRKAGEGCDDKQWKKTYVLKKKVEEEEDEEEEEYEVIACLACV
jgi:plasminogen activator inhibitor 1 RNA-binding protein